MEYYLIISSVLILLLVLFLTNDLRKLAKEINPEYKSKFDRNLWIMSLLLILSIIVIPFIYIILFKEFTSAETGYIGDTIGGITAPFINGFAAVLVYLALKAQIDANKQVQKQFAKQQIESIKINFENTFFNVLNIHHQIVDRMDFKLSRIFENKETEVGANIETLVREHLKTEKKVIADLDEPLTSRDVFKETRVVLQSLISKFVINPNSEEAKKHSKDTLYRAVYNYVYEIMGSDLGHYYRNLYRIFKLIDIQDFGVDEEKSNELKYHYSSIVRAQLSDDEIIWLYYNGIFDYGVKFKPLIEKFSLLKILKRNDEITIKEFKDKYNGKAFDKDYSSETSTK